MKRLAVALSVAGIIFTACGMVEVRQVRYDGNALSVDPPAVYDPDHPLALGTNVTVNTSARSGRFLVARAASFVEAESLGSWTATVDGRSYRFVISGGKDLYLTVDSSLVLILKSADVAFQVFSFPLADKLQLLIEILYNSLSQTGTSQSIRGKDEDTKRSSRCRARFLRCAGSCRHTHRSHHGPAPALFARHGV